MGHAGGACQAWCPVLPTQACGRLCYWWVTAKINLPNWCPGPSGSGICRALAVHETSSSPFAQFDLILGWTTWKWLWATWNYNEMLKQPICERIGHGWRFHALPWIAQLRSCWNPLNEDKRIFSVNLISVMAADVLAPGLAKASADMLHSLACKKKIAWVVSFQFTVECAEFLGQSESLPRW